jgi:hypothetical protein
MVQMAAEGDITNQLWTVHQVSEKSVKHTIIESDLIEETKKTATSSESIVPTTCLFVQSCLIERASVLTPYSMS